MCVTDSGQLVYSCTQRLACVMLGNYKYLLARLLHWSLWCVNSKHHTLIVPLLLITAVHLLPHNRQQLGEELYNACGPHGDVRRVRELLKRGADVNWKKSTGWTPLYRACLHNKSDIVKELLKYKPTENQLNQQANYSKETALHAACRCGDLDCVKLLLATGQCDLG